MLDERLIRALHVEALRRKELHAERDPSTDLHLELPPGVELDSPDLSSSTHDAIDRVEHSG